MLQALAIEKVSLCELVGCDITNLKKACCDRLLLENDTVEQVCKILEG